MTKEIQITFTGENYAFAITQDNFQQAYIPNSILIQMGDVSVGDVFEAAMVENDRDPRGRTPWFVTYIAQDKPEETTEFEPLKYLFDEVEKVGVRPRRSKKTVSQIVRDAVPLMDGKPFIATELADIAGVTNSEASTVLNNMFTLDQMSCAKIYKSGGQARSTQTVWCDDVRELLK